MLGGKRSEAAGKCLHSHYLIATAVIVDMIHAQQSQIISISLSRLISRERDFCLETQI